MKFLPWMVAGIYILGWHIQNQLLVNSDVSWLVEAARRMLAGGSYTNQFFEINPPFILYLYTPVILLTKLFSLSTGLAIRIYVFFLSSLSLVICSRLLSKILSPTDRLLNSTLLITLATLYLLLPMNEFGQREHLLVILCMPYFLLVASRLQDKHHYSTTASLLIGVLAGIGFAIKPYFLTAYIMVEAYYRSPRRPETIGVLGILILYALILVSFHQDYLTIIMPLISQFYYQQYQSSVSAILLGDQAFYFYFTILFFCTSYRRMVYKQLATILMLASFGFFISYCMQRTNWYYHILPALSFNILLLVLVFTDLITRKKIIKKEIALTLICASLMLGYLIYRINYITQSIYFYPKTYFAFFAVLFSVLLYAAYNKNRRSIIISTTIIMVAGYFFNQYLQITIFQPHLFALTTLMLFLLYILCIPNNGPNSKVKFTFLACLGSILFCYPIYQISSINAAAKQYKSQYMGLVNEMRKYPGQSIFFLTDSGEFSFPALDMSNLKLGSRFTALIGFQIKSNTILFAKWAAEDLRQYQPDLIFVDVRQPDLEKHLRYYGNSQIDYLRVFKTNSAFNEAFKSYHYIKTIDGQPVYKFAIYEKTNTRL